jgi:hypothetical protein
VGSTGSPGGWVVQVALDCGCYIKPGSVVGTGSPVVWVVKGALESTALHQCFNDFFMS